jgi:hypothetical protein
MVMPVLNPPTILLILLPLLHKNSFQLLGLLVDVLVVELMDVPVEATLDEADFIQDVMFIKSLVETPELILVLQLRLLLLPFLVSLEVVVVDVLMAELAV